MNIAIIPARKNSRRFKGKNEMKIQGKTLIEIALNHAIDSKIFDKIILTTDIEAAISNIKRKCKNVICIKREKKLCRGDVSMYEVVFDVLKKENIKGEDIICILQPTSPLRNKDDILKAFALYKKAGTPVLSVYLIDSSLLFTIKCGKLKKMNTNDNIAGKQNGAVYIFAADELKKHKKIPETGTAYIMDEKRSIDIDYKYQFETAKMMIENTED